MEYFNTEGEGCQKKRKLYAEMNIENMGVKLEASHKYTNSQCILQYPHTDGGKEIDVAYYNSFGSPDSMDSGINMESCNVQSNVASIIKSVNDIKEPLTKRNSETPQNYICPIISPAPYENNNNEQTSNLDEEVDTTHIEQNDVLASVIHKILPEGWEKHEDKNGSYYWHIKSGTIQREIPTTIPESSDLILPDLNPYSNSNLILRAPDKLDNMKSNDDDINHKRDFSKYRSISLNYTQNSVPLIFHVKSLGWCEINESDLTPEKSSKAVNKCIMDLSYGRNSIETIGKWGEGQNLLLEIDSHDIKLKNRGGILITTQPIHSIKVWGVGKENGKDFAYVVRDDPSTGSVANVTTGAQAKYVCYVFRCESSAYSIANTLKTVCKRLMIERSNAAALMHQNSQRLKKRELAADNGSGSSINKSVSCHEMAGSLPDNFFARYNECAKRPRDLSILGQGRGGEISPIDVGFLLDSSRCFPTPIEEPFRILKALYIGEIKVAKPSGIDVLNEAIDTMRNKVPRSSWTPVSVKVSPSCITILKQESPPECPHPDSVLTTCRVRYLSFLGIGRDTRTCGFIMSSPPTESADCDDTFLCQALHCEPTAAALCKIIEAACRLRYQKCLDSARNRSSLALMVASNENCSTANSDNPSVKNLTTALKSMWNSIIWKHQSYTP